jgi:MFS family permease
MSTSATDSKPLRNPAMLVAWMCVAQVFVQIGAYTWPALLPTYLVAWDLSSADAGWITGAFYLAYVVSVPVLVSLTDRTDPRRIYLFGVSLTILAHAGFAVFADSFWSGLVLRALAGVGWAGTYMTGLKLLADHIDGRLMSRAVAGHAASIGLAGGLSYAFAGGVESMAGTSGAFAVAAGCASAALVTALVLIPSARKRKTDAKPPGHLLDFRPVLRNRGAMAYAFAYCVHTWEMSALRGWAVVFLTWVAAQDVASEEPWLAPVVVATIMGLTGTGTSYLGNEISIRFGRARLIRVAMYAGIVIALGIGWFGSFNFSIAATFVVLYGGIIWLDSSSLTAGTTGNAEPGRRGATLAVHSMLGYIGGFAGPVIMGLVLHLCGGPSQIGWAIAFAHLAIVGLVGRIVFDRLGPRPLAGEKD